MNDIEFNRLVNLALDILNGISDKLDRLYTLHIEEEKKMKERQQSSDIFEGF